MASHLESPAFRHGECQTVLDVREAIAGNNVRVVYFLTIVLENADGNRYYYEYVSCDDKSSEYINMAKLHEGDFVSYQNGHFFIQKTISP